MQLERMPQINTYDQHWQEARAAAEADGLQIIEHGWEQHVIIDAEQGLVYRYPRHDAAAAKLEDEVKVLADIHKQKWSISLPYIREHTPFYTAYDYIPGEVLDEFELNSLREDTIEDIGFRLGAFLEQLHRLDPQIVEQKQTKQSTTLLEYYTNRIGHGRYTEFYTKASAELEKLQNASSDFKHVVVHGDLHGLNMVIDPVTKQLNGVIDLSEMEVGDPHQDFRKLFMTDPRLLEPAIAAYQQHGGQTINSDLAKTWAYVNEWANICHFADTPDNLTYQRAQEHLARWHQL